MWQNVFLTLSHKPYTVYSSIFESSNRLTFGAFGCLLQFAWDNSWLITRNLKYCLYFNEGLVLYLSTFFPHIFETDFFKTNPLGVGGLSILPRFNNDPHTTKYVLLQVWCRSIDAKQKKILRYSKARKKTRRRSTEKKQCWVFLKRSHPFTFFLEHTVHTVRVTDNEPNRWFEERFERDGTSAASIIGGVHHQPLHFTRAQHVFISQFQWLKRNIQ